MTTPREGCTEKCLVRKLENFTQNDLWPVSWGGIFGVLFGSKLWSFLSGFFHAKGQDFQWTTQHQSTFDAMKHALIPQSYSTTPVPLTPLASPLTHLTWAVDGNWKPLAFFSRKLQHHWPWASGHVFSKHLEGRQFHIYTDHKPQIFALVNSYNNATSPF